MKKIFFFILLGLALTSCGDTLSSYTKKRVVCLKDNTVNWVYLERRQNIYRTSDTVWMNYRTHRISFDSHPAYQFTSDLKVVIQ